MGDNMIHTQYITKCKNEKCSKKDDCIRYTKATGAIIDFEHICDEKHNYQWFWEEEKRLTTTE